jgi:hypothetical protein
MFYIVIPAKAGIHGGRKPPGPGVTARVIMDSALSLNDDALAGKYGEL